MEQKRKPVRMSRHALEQLGHRGCTEEEIEETIWCSQWQPADMERQECRRTYPYNREWNGKLYATKTVRPIFVEEKEAVVVITVYVYYQ